MLCKHSNLSSITRTNTKIQIWWCSHISSALGLEREMDPWGSLARQTRLLSRLRANEGLCLTERFMAPKESFLNCYSPLIDLHTHVHTSFHICIHVLLHTHTYTLIGKCFYGTFNVLLSRDTRKNTRTCLSA